VDDKRNLVIAVLLTVLVLFGWSYVSEAFFPQPEASAPATAVNGADTPAGGVPDGDAPTAADSAAPATGSSSSAVVGGKAATISLNEALSSPDRVKIDTPKLRGSINLQGARIDDLLLLAHREELPKDSPPVRLFAPAGTAEAYFARFGWVGDGLTAPGADTLWQASGDTISPDSPVTLTYSNDAGETYELMFRIDANYMLSVDQRFTNRSAKAAQVATFGILRREGESADPDTWNIHSGPMGVFDGQPNYDWDYDDVLEAPNSEADFKSTGGWLGFTDKYWLAALIPGQDRKINAKFLERSGAYITQMVTAQQTIVAPGRAFTQDSKLFAGAKEVVALEDYSNREGIPYLDYSIDWGWFWFIAIPFFWILHWLFELLGNFGVAIIGLTIIVRLLLFPIAQKQFASMAQMRAVQPKMKVVQERYKDDKQKQQQEIMKLYKEEKVNPLAGCLPIILQIPIFFALYKLLMLSIEMRHQPFVLWLKDLSEPDPLTPVNLFGLLPFDPPALIAIGILPILLGITMWLMQRLNPQPMDDIQKQVFAIMPWFLMFIMAPFAAGLQLYWVVSNLISIGQQKLLYARHPQLKKQMADEAVKKEQEKAAEANKA